MKENINKKLRVFFLILFVLVFLVIQMTIKIPLIDRALFIVNFIVLFFFTMYYLYIYKVFAPSISSFIVFSFLFFIIAPMYQLEIVIEQERNSFFNGLRYSSYQFRKTNLFIILFNLIFFLTYFIKPFKNISTQNILAKIKPKIPFIILTLFAISLLVFLLEFDLILNNNVYSNNRTHFPKMQAIINSKFVLFLPLGPLAISSYYIKSNWKKRSKNFYIILVLFFILLGIMLFFKNPLNEKRNALGPLYLSIIFLIIPWVINSNLRLILILFFGLILVFPLLTFYTHFHKTYRNDSLNIELLKERMSQQYVNPHFDAYIMGNASIDHVESRGLYFGDQLKSSFLFFIPRAFWENKPISSGELMGRHIQKKHNKKTTFHNLSCPFFAEGYLNFGILGIVFFAITLAALCRKSTRWVNSDDVLKKLAAFYFSIHLIFLLRGDFTNGYVYFVLPFTAFYIMPKILIYLIKVR